jgi:hypothetical protein
MPPAIKPSLSRVLTLIISVFLLVEGIWGLFRPVVFGILTTNRAHAVIHIVLGIGGLLACWKGAIKGYFGFLGSLFIVVALLWFIPAWRNMPRDLLNVNWAVAVLALILGIVSLTIAFTENARRRFGKPTGRTMPPMGMPTKGGTRPGFKTGRSN